MPVRFADLPAIHALAQGRRDLARAADGLVLPAVAGVHPCAAAEGELEKAFADWAGTENLEERVDGVDRVDPIVLAALRKPG